MKKTIPVEDIRTMYEAACLAKPENYVINAERSSEAVVAELNNRLIGMSDIFSNVLMLTDNYRGFGYIDRQGRLIGLDHPEFFEHRRKYFL